MQRSSITAHFEITWEQIGKVWESPIWGLNEFKGPCHRNLKRRESPSALIQSGLVNLNLHLSTNQNALIVTVYGTSENGHDPLAYYS